MSQVSTYNYKINAEKTEEWQSNFKAWQEKRREAEWQRKQKSKNFLKKNISQLSSASPSAQQLIRSIRPSKRDLEGYEPEHKQTDFTVNEVKIMTADDNGDKKTADWSI